MVHDHSRVVVRVSLGGALCLVPDFSFLYVIVLQVSLHLFVQYVIDFCFISVGCARVVFVACDAVAYVSNINTGFTSDMTYWHLGHRLRDTVSWAGLVCIRSPLRSILS